MHYLPSIKKLQSIGLEPETARLVRLHLQVIRGDFMPATLIPLLPPAVIEWARSCYHSPSKREKHHAAVAYLITEGRTIVWEVFQPQEEWTSFNEGPSWEAVEVGDPYIPTLILRNGRYFVGAWGDMPEANRV